MRSPHRARGDWQECWIRLLFGEIVRVVDHDVVVRAEPDIKLPKSGRWETGLAQLRPALDDALGATALAVSWRWASAGFGSNAWPGLPLIARKATDRSVNPDSLSELAVFQGGGAIVEGEGELTWTLAGVASIGVRGVRADFGEVDRIANIAAAWLERDWKRTG